MTKRTLLIDADVVAYQAASALEEAVEWEPGFWTWSVCFDAVCARTLGMIQSAVETLEADRAVLCLTDPAHNFRLDVLPSYKTHRKTVRKPLVLFHLKQWLVENHDAKLLPGLEGDDLMGILATTPSSDERIIVSIDKDMKTIPGPYVRTRAVVSEDGAELVGAWDITEVTEQEAAYNHLYQTLIGDTTDGYKGCPAVGPARATELLELEDTIANNWKRVVEAFEKKKLGEEEALVQARVARILHASDYDLKKRKVKLWEPPV